jgi:hypothetical protein
MAPSKLVEAHNALLKNRKPSEALAIEPAGRPKPIADDIFQCGAEEYPQTQRWAGWFRSQASRADGIVWVSHQYNLGQCLALFADRCGRRLKLDGKVVPLYGRSPTARIRPQRAIE